MHVCHPPQGERGAGQSVRQYLPFSLSPRPIFDRNNNERRLLKQSPRIGFVGRIRGIFCPCAITYGDNMFGLDKWNSLIDEQYTLREQHLRRLSSSAIK